MKGGRASQGTRSNEDIGRIVHTSEYTPFNTKVQARVADMREHESGHCPDGITEKQRGERISRMMIRLPYSKEFRPMTAHHRCADGGLRLERVQERTPRKFKYFATQSIATKYTTSLCTTLENIEHAPKKKKSIFVRGVAWRDLLPSTQGREVTTDRHNAYPHVTDGTSFLAENSMRESSFGLRCHYKMRADFLLSVADCMPLKLMETRNFWCSRQRATNATNGI